VGGFFFFLHPKKVTKRGFFCGGGGEFAHSLSPSGHPVIVVNFL